MADSTPGTATGTSSSPKIDAIRALIKEGYILIPLRGKVPTIRNWTATAPGQYREEQLGKAGQNYGLVLGASDLVIDVDPRAFKPADDKPLTRLCALVPGLDVVLQNTFVVKTGGNGLHVYLSKPADLTIRQALDGFPGLELKTAGRQTVGPGSVHPETQRTYEIIRGKPASVLPAPAGLLELLTAPKASAQEEVGTDSYVDDEATRGRYEAYLLTAAPAVEGKSGDNETFKVACHGRDMGLPPKSTWELMLAVWNPRCSPPWSPEDLKVKVLNAYKFAQGAVGSKHPSAAGFEKLEAAAAEAGIPAHAKDGVDTDDIAWNMNGGRVTKSLFNLMNFLKWKQGGLYKVFGYNQFTGQVEFTGAAPWHKGRRPASPLVQDDDLKLLRAFLVNKHDFEAGICDIENALTAVAHGNSFHPVREYLSGLKWDGKSRLDGWLRDYCGAADDAYTRAVARKVLCAAVTRVFKPGCKFDHVLVLEGAQGIGKSSVVKILGGPWAGDFTIDPHNKDTVQQMQGAWLCEIAELEFKGRAEEDAIKAFITRATDKVRLAYGRYATEFPRQSVFIATKNPASDGTFLKDETGGRRWWPVSCHGLRGHGGKVDFKGLKDARDQLFAEALERVKSVGEALYMETAELSEAQREVVDQRRAEHPWTGKIAEWIRGRADRPGFLTGMEIWTDCLGGVPRDFLRREQIGIASAMRALGWVTHISRAGEDRLPTRGYAPCGAPTKKKEPQKPLDSLASLY